MIPDGTKVNSAFLHELDIRFMKELVSGYMNKYPDADILRITKLALGSGVLDEYHRLISNITPIICSGIISSGAELSPETFSAGIHFMDSQYPAYSSKKKKLQRSTIRQIAEILRALRQDRDTISETFGISAPEEPESIELGLGDRHRGGRTVARICYKGGQSIFFKPRELSADKHFYELEEIICHKLGLEYKPVRILTGKGYSWEEEIRYIPCRSEEEVRRFYYRSGIVLFLSFILNGSDVHYENLIANGEYPRIIDLESIFVPPMPIEGMESNQKLFRNILRCGLIPTDFIPGSDKKISMAGLADTSSVESPHESIEYKYDKDGQIKAVGHTGLIEEGRNIPTLNGEKKLLEDYPEQICDGFRDAYRLVLSEKEEFIRIVRKSFRNDTVRIIFRNTRLYAGIRNQTYKAQLMKSISGTREYIESLLQEDIVDYRILGRIYKHELKSLMNCDMPLFTTKTGSRDLWFSRYDRIKDFFETTGKDAVLENLDEMSEEELERQSWILRAASVFPASIREVHIPKAPQEEDIAKGAYDFILKNIHVTDRYAYWLNFQPSSLERSTYYLTEASFDLFMGMPGTIIFLCAYGKIYNSEEAIIIGKKAYAYLNDLMEKAHGSMMPLGLYAGWGSIIFLNTKMYEILGDRKYLDANKKILGCYDFRMRIRRDTNYTLLKGSAGFIVSICNYLRYNPDDNAKELAEVAAKHLIDNAREFGEGIGWKIVSRVPLSGLAHGSSGFALAFLGLCGLFPEKTVYRETLKRILTYENSLFDPGQGNWKDLRDYIRKKHGDNYCSTAWSHGAGGIGLVRLEMVKKGITDVRPELETAIRTVLRDGFTDNFELSYGSFGNLELLFNYYLYQKDPAIEDYLRKITGLLESRYAAGKYTMGAPFWNMSFMTNLPGVGYEYLRLKNPDLLRSVLIPDV